MRLWKYLLGRSVVYEPVRLPRAGCVVVEPVRLLESWAACFRI
jgi:hypothetical protein